MRFKNNSSFYSKNKLHHIYQKLLNSNNMQIVSDSIKLQRSFRSKKIYVPYHRDVLQTQICYCKRENSLPSLRLKTWSTLALSTF